LAVSVHQILKEGDTEAKVKKKGKKKLRNAITEHLRVWQAHKQVAR
jgi:hypothetical protein